MKMKRRIKMRIKIRIRLRIRIRKRKRIRIMILVLIYIFNLVNIGYWRDLWRCTIWIPCHDRPTPTKGILSRLM